MMRIKRPVSALITVFALSCAFIFTVTAGEPQLDNRSLLLKEPSSEPNADGLVSLVFLVVQKFFNHQGHQAIADPKTSSKRQEIANPPRHAADVPDADGLKLLSSEMRATIERYTVDRGSLARSFPVEISPARQARLKQFYAEWLAALARLDFDSMSQEGKADYLLLKNHLDHELRQLDIQAKTLAEAAPLLPFAQTIIDLEEARRQMELVDPPKVAALLSNLSRQIEATRRSVEAGLRVDGRPESKAEGNSDATVEPIKLKKTIANRALATISDLRSTLRGWFGFYNGYDPIFTWWVDEPYKSVDQRLQNYSAFLSERVVGVRPSESPAAMAETRTVPERGRGEAPAISQRPTPERRGPVGARPASDIIGDPIGREALLVELAYEMIPYTPEELIAIANKEFAWCEAEMKKASSELGYGDDWMKALEYVKTQYVEPGKQPELIRDLTLEAIKFVDDHDLVTVPQLARETWRMEMMTPERQLVNPFFTGGETIRVSYPTNAMSHEQKLMSMRGNNIHFARATVFHEMIPGHHLQGFMAARFRPYRGLFSTPFWGEGGALYWEMLLWDMNFAKTPENRIGMLFWRMYRCARVIFSLSFHLGRMTPQECIDFLIKRVGHEPENATAEVRRSFSGNDGPLYQAAYLLGGLQLRSLHRELVESGKMTNRAFHDAVLKENRIPIEMLRAILTTQKLTRNFTSSWKFYKE